MNPQTRSAVDFAEKGGYLPALRAIAKGSCVPFWWHGPTATGGYRVFHNGTLCLVDTGERQIGVTADHVFAGYLSDKQTNPEIVCQLGSTTCLPEKHLIDRSKTLDLATFDLSEVVAAASGGRFHAPGSWPASTIQERDVLLLGGYPGGLRKERQVTAELPFQWFAGAATSVSSSNVSLHLDLANRHQPLVPSGAINAELGGMSGGPVFRVIANPIERLALVGFIYEYQASFELLLARPAECVLPNGRLAPL